MSSTIAQAGRPEIGAAIHVRLGDLLPAIDEFAARAGLSRAAAVRRLTTLGLAAVTPPDGMRPIVIGCDVVTGRIEIKTADWSDDDARWDFAISPDNGAVMNAADVEPWGEGELGMERATEAARDLGYTVGEWTECDGQTWHAVVIGRA